jgi:hypothetical protein
MAHPDLYAHETGSRTSGLIAVCLAQPDTLLFPTLEPPAAVLLFPHKSPR